METCGVSPKDSGETVAGAKDVKNDQVLSVTHDFLGKGVIVHTGGLVDLLL